MLMLVDCSSCRTPLQLTPGNRFITCAICHAITRVADLSFYALPSLAPSHYNQSLCSVNGRKRAVICGISYKNTRGVPKLEGCINDAKCMKHLLIKKFMFPESSILMLTEEETDSCRIPTKHNIRMAMFWLVQGCQPGDSLVFYYSGHGSRKRNYTNDEIDEYDETLCPSDVESNGVIVDDEINATMVKPLPYGVRLHAIIDACCSGTVLDLPFLCRMERNGRYAWVDHSPPSGVFKGTNGGEVISFSGCDDDQFSAETHNQSKAIATGRMTSSFIKAIESGHGTTYGDLLTSIRTIIYKDEILDGDGNRQEPQLTANEPFDINRKQFFL
ncbi:hypothetical protein M8C21_014774 [Ambrosia artemisiifolia]|uniref:Metacaspase-1 n=1 Tax=Ambrosia artemisiifolia TaxID=4212 RepID=A0AAD5BY18_AMBAR|nr:hypothetical protein M8C21_014774 [Ambrosia artemisiifolia]